MTTRLILAAVLGLLLAVAPLTAQPLDSPPSPLPTITLEPAPTDTPTPGDAPTITPIGCDTNCAPNPPRCPTVLWNHPAGCTPTPTPTPHNSGWNNAATARAIPHRTVDKIR